MIRISFLLPCYNVEKYVRDSIDSIYKIHLPADEFEVLCFDDCSPDSTPQLLDELAAEHSNMHVIHSQENVGSGGGRNILIREAQGKYIWYIDPDDLIVSGQVISLLSQAEEHELDVLLFNYTDVTFDGQRQESGSSFRDTEVYNGLSFIDKVFCNNVVWHMGYPWRFIIRREYVKSIHLQFPERIVFQDTVWTPKLMMYAERIQSSHIVGYYYRHHGASVCGRFDTIYPGKSIFTWSIVISGLLIDFARELDLKKNTDSRYAHYSKVFRDFAVSHYLNALPLLLSRTNRKERRSFYQLLRSHRIHNELKGRATVLTKLCLQSGIGLCFSHMISAAYKMTHYTERR